MGDVISGEQRFLDVEKKREARIRTEFTSFIDDSLNKPFAHMVDTTCENDVDKQLLCIAFSDIRDKLLVHFIRNTQGSSLKERIGIVLTTFEDIFRTVEYANKKDLLGKVFSALEEKWKTQFSETGDEQSATVYSLEEHRKSKE